MYQIGLDISTSVIGISVFHNQKFHELKHINLSKVKCIFEKSRKTEIVLNALFQQYQVDKIYIEDTLQSFSRGMSSARTLMQLAKFNGIVSNIAYRLTNIKPVYINVNTARKTLQIKIDKTINVDKKEQIVEWVNNDLGSYNWPKKTISRGINKGVVKFENFCYDMADAYVICKAGIIIENEYTSE